MLKAACGSIDIEIHILEIKYTSLLIKIASLLLWHTYSTFRWYETKDLPREKALKTVPKIALLKIEPRLSIKTRLLH